MVRIVVAVHEQIAVVRHDEGVVDEPRAGNDFVDVADRLEDLLALFKIELGDVALFLLDFFVRGERHDDLPDLVRLLQKADVTVVEERGRHVDHDAQRLVHVEILLEVDVLHAKTAVFGRQRSHVVVAVFYLEVDVGNTGAGHLAPAKVERSRDRQHFSDRKAVVLIVLGLVSQTREMRSMVRLVAKVVADGSAGILQETQQKLVRMPGGVAVAAVDPLLEMKEFFRLRARFTKDKKIQEDGLPFRHVLSADEMITVVTELNDALALVDFQMSGQFRLQSTELLEIGAREHEVDVVVPGDETVVAHGAEERPEGEHVLDPVGFAEIVKFEKKVLQLFVIALTLVVGEFKLHG